MANDLRRALGEEIRYYRTKRRLSREDLAERTGISVSTLGRIEREGPVDVAHLARIADVLAVRLSAIVKRAEESVIDSQLPLKALSEMTLDEIAELVRSSGAPAEKVQRDFDLAAHDEDYDIEDEQGHDEHP